MGPGAVLFLALDKLSRTGRSRRSERENAALALLFAFGTVYWFTAVQGTVWFAAHVVAVALTTVYLYAALDAAHPLVAGLALALAFGSRAPLGFAFPLFLYEAYRAGVRTDPPAPAEAVVDGSATVRRGPGSTRASSSTGSPSSPRPRRPCSPCSSGTTARASATRSSSATGSS